MPRAGIFASSLVQGGGSGIVGTYRQTVVASDITDDRQTFFGMDIGTPTPDRRVVVTIEARHSGGMSPATSVTIQGIAAVIHVDITETTGNNEVVIASAIVPTGATADVRIDFSSSGFIRATCSTWDISGASEFSNSDSGVDASVIALSTSPGSFMVAAAVTEWSSAELSGVDVRYAADHVTYFIVGDAVEAGSATFTTNAGQDNAAAIATFDAA